MTKTRFTIGNRTYELVPFPRDWESKNPIVGETMEDGDGAIMKNQVEIPKELRKFHLVFPAWRHPNAPQFVACITWNGVCWCKFWCLLGSWWSGEDYLVRRCA